MLSMVLMAQAYAWAQTFTEWHDMDVNGVNRMQNHTSRSRIVSCRYMATGSSSGWRVSHSGPLISSRPITMIPGGIRCQYLEYGR